MNSCRARTNLAPWVSPWALAMLLALPMGLVGCGGPGPDSTPATTADGPSTGSAAATVGQSDEAATPAAPAGPPPEQTADAIYSGGEILTMNDAAPTAEAIAVKDGRILAIGTADEMQAHKGSDTRLVDLAGRTLLPGFIDAHGHVSMVGLQALAANLLPPPDGGADSIENLQSALRDWTRASAIPTDSGIIIGFGYDEFRLKQQRAPGREDLDAVSRDLPVIALEQSGDSGAYNSRALELAGITAASKDPPGGVIRRRAGSREPSGVLEGTAHLAAFGALLPKLGDMGQLALLETGGNLYARSGYTTAQDSRTIPAQLPTFIRAAEEGRLIMDVVAYPDVELLADDAPMAGPYYGREYKNGFRIGGVKLTLDGALANRTAWLAKPYYKAPAGRKRGYAGGPLLTDAQATAAVSRAFHSNWQLVVHANGDAAVDQLVRVARAATAQYPDAGRRTVLVDGQVLRENQLPALKELGLVPSLATPFTWFWGDWYRDTVLGRARAENLAPAGWLHKRALQFTTHADAPATFPDALRQLAATVNRTTRSGKLLGARQRVEPLVALKSMTLWAAWQIFEEDSKGSLEAGKLADFVILSANPLATPREKLADIQVVETIKAGRRIFSREAPPEESVWVGCGGQPGCDDGQGSGAAEAPAPAPRPRRPAPMAPAESGSESAAAPAAIPATAPGAAPAVPADPGSPAAPAESPPAPPVPPPVAAPPAPPGA